MFQLTQENAIGYLAARDWPGARQATITPLGGGVSNVVLLAESPAGRIVCKQALEKLRVEADWRSRPDRTLREADALQAVAPLLPPDTVPEIIFIDRPNCIYAMAAAPAGASDWKTALLGGHIHPAVAQSAGLTLGAIIRRTFQNPAWEAQFGDQTVFDELRLDPYYRFTAARHPEFVPFFQSLIESCRTHRVSLVHGDWSPKNLLTAGDGVLAIDFEVVHYGNPCFDTGFLLCHLLMKSIHRPADAAALHVCAQAFWRALALEPEISWLWEGTVAHLGGLLLARADGKSPAEYLNAAEKHHLRCTARRIISAPPQSIEQIWQCL